MIAALTSFWDRFRGFGDHALSIPSLDGAFMPNSLLDAAERVCHAPEADNLVIHLGRPVFSVGRQLLRLEAEGPQPHADLPGEVTALAAAGDGRLIVAIRGGDIIVIAGDGEQHRRAGPVPESDITALAVTDAGGIAVAIGAEGQSRGHWRHDLMLGGRTGSVWLLDPAGATQPLARGLAYPFGIAGAAGGGFVVSTAWDHALVHVGAKGGTRTVLANLPGYPARVIPARGGGFWLAIFAPRNQLVEFVLREKVYRQRMMAEISPDNWVAPQLRPLTSPLAAMQGAERIGGAMKPWAPVLSYGMIVRLSADFVPEHTLHSRADGNRHGILSLAQLGDTLYATSAGAEGIIAVEAE